MTNLFKPDDKLDKKVTQTISILEKLKQLKSNTKHTLLIDLSGSMYDYMGDHKTKREAVEEIVRKLPIGLKKFAFSEYCERFESEFPSMGGGTNLSGAFAEMKRQAIAEVILITDGLPDSAPAALRESKGLKIEIIYIGPLPRPQFLEDLAAGSGGSFITVDMIKAGAAGELENKIKGLLGS